MFCARGRGRGGGARRRSSSSLLNNARYNESAGKDKGGTRSIHFLSRHESYPLYQLISPHGSMNIMTPQDNDDEQHIMAAHVVDLSIIIITVTSCTYPDHNKLFACIRCT